MCAGIGALVYSFKHVAWVGISDSTTSHGPEAMVLTVSELPATP